MIESIKVNPRSMQSGCGIYEVEGDSYVRLFITDAGRVIPLRGVITEDDLMLAFQWGCREKWEPTGGWHDDEELEMADVLNSPEREVSAGDPAKESQ